MKTGIVGGIEAVVKAINTHIDNVDVCFVGCGALLNMTLNNGKILPNNIKIKRNEQLRTE